MIDINIKCMTKMRALPKGRKLDTTSPLVNLVFSNLAGVVLGKTFPSPPQPHQSRSRLMSRGNLTTFLERRVACCRMYDVGF